MSKGKVNVTQLVAGLNLVRNAKESWPDGYANPFVQEVLQEGAKELNERLIKALTIKSGRKE